MMHLTSMSRTNFARLVLFLAWIGVVAATAHLLYLDFSLGVDQAKGTAETAWHASPRAALLGFWLMLLWPMLQLHRIGKRLRSEAEISEALSRDVAGLGNAVTLLLAFGIVVKVPYATALAPSGYAFESLHFTTIYCLLLSVVCLHATAFVLFEASRLKKENQEFV